MLQVYLTPSLLVELRLPSLRITLRQLWMPWLLVSAKSLSPRITHRLLDRLIRPLVPHQLRSLHTVQHHRSPPYRQMLTLPSRHTRQVSRIVSLQAMLPLLSLHTDRLLMSPLYRLTRMSPSLDIIHL